MAPSATLAAMAWEESLVPPGPVPPDLGAWVRRARGTVSPWVARAAPAPWLVRAFIQMTSKPVAFIPPALCDLIGLVVSQDNSCRYCFGIQRTIMRVLGYSEEQLERLERDYHLADLSPAERAALDFARNVSRADPRVCAAERDVLLAAGYTPAAVAEIAFVAAGIVFANRGATLLALPPEPLERFVERPLGRLIRPFLAWQMRSRPRAPEPLAGPNDGPCAAVVATLDGSPAANVLRRVIDEAWASPILPRRTKALILAVVARALACARSEAEAAGMLAADGVDAGELERILATLASPQLDAREARLVPFARDSVRYDHTVPIQRRMREAAAGLTPAETVEAAGWMAIANAVCRLSVLLDVC